MFIPSARLFAVMRTVPRVLLVEVSVHTGVNKRVACHLAPASHSLIVLLGLLGVRVLATHHLATGPSISGAVPYMLLVFLFIFLLGLLLLVITIFRISLLMLRLLPLIVLLVV